MFLTLEELTSDHKSHVECVWNNVCQVLENGKHIGNGFTVNKLGRVYTTANVVNNVRNVTLRFVVNGKDFIVIPTSYNISTSHGGMYLNFEVSLDIQEMYAQMYRHISFDIIPWKQIPGDNTIAMITFIDNERKLFYGNISTLNMSKHVGAPVFILPNDEHRHSYLSKYVMGVITVEGIKRFTENNDAVSEKITIDRSMPSVSDPQLDINELFCANHLDFICEVLYNDVVFSQGFVVKIGASYQVVTVFKTGTVGDRHRDIKLRFVLNKEYHIQSVHKIRTRVTYPLPDVEPTESCDLLIMDFAPDRQLAEAMHRFDGTEFVLPCQRVDAQYFTYEIMKFVGEKLPISFGTVMITPDKQKVVKSFGKFNSDVELFAAKTTWGYTKSGLPVFALIKRDLPRCFGTPHVMGVTYGQNILNLYDILQFEKNNKK